MAHEGVDACIVATPTPSHVDDVRLALSRGCHVLCEKPVSLSPAATRALADQARRADRILQVGFWRRFSPPWQSAQRAIAEGQIGEPVYLRLSQWDADPPPAAFCDPEVSGGLAVDCGVHEFDLAEWLTGDEVVNVQAWATPPVSEDVASVGDVDNAIAVLNLQGGAIATVDLSRNCRYGDDVRTEILGSEGAIFIETIPVGRALIATADGRETLSGSEAADAIGEGLARQAGAFAAAVRGYDVDVPSAEQSARATEIGLAMQEATSTNTSVSLATT